MVVGHVDIEKYMSLFLTKPGTQSVLNAPNNCLILMDCSDGFSLAKMVMSFHRRNQCKSKTTIIEPYNLLSTVLTVTPCLWSRCLQTT